MQICPTFTHHLPYSSRLHKTASLPNFQEQAINRETYSESVEEGCWRKCAKWIMRLRRKTNISKCSLYLAVSYLGRLVRMGFPLNEDNWEKVAVSLVLISAKMNEIYPPKMTSLLSKCSKHLSKHELTLTESEVLQTFNFQMSYSEITYSYLLRALACESEDKRDDGEKLLGLAVTQLEIMKLGEEVIALGIVYLIRPSLMREYNYPYNNMVKNAASKIYNLYVANKANTIKN